MSCSGQSKFNLNLPNPAHLVYKFFPHHLLFPRFPAANLLNFSAPRSLASRLELGSQVDLTTGKEMALYFFPVIFFPTSFSTRFPLGPPFGPPISAPTGFHDWGLETRWAQLLITSSYYLPSTPKDQSTMRAEQVNHVLKLAFLVA